MRSKLTYNLISEAAREILSGYQAAPTHGKDLNGLCQTKFARRQNVDGRDSQAISSHHSARAAARFCLKISRRLRWRS